MINKIKETHKALQGVWKGITSCSTGGCCGVSLPKEERQQLKALKEGKQAKK